MVPRISAEPQLGCAGGAIMDFRRCSAAVLALCVPGCAQQQQLQMVAGPGQETAFRDGLPALVSKRRHMVMLRPNKVLVPGNERAAFTLAVRNGGTKPENLMISGISASQTLNGKQHEVRLYRYEELVQEEKTRQAWLAFGAALGGVGRAMSASNAGYVTTTGSVYGHSPYGPAYGTYTATTYDPLRAQIAQQNAAAQTDADFAAIRASGERSLAQVQMTILKDNTVMPGEWIGGTIILAPPEFGGDAPSTSYTVVVDFGGELHEFTIAQRKI
jgi:hypothetical protein